MRTRPVSSTSRFRHSTKEDLINSAALDNGEDEAEILDQKRGYCKLTRGSVFKIFESVEAILTGSKERY